MAPRGREAKGDYIWLCEADDAAHPAFLARLVEAMERAGAPLLAFADSRAVDAKGRRACPAIRTIISNPACGS